MTDGTTWSSLHTKDIWVCHHWQWRESVKHKISYFNHRLYVVHRDRPNKIHGSLPLNALEHPRSIPVVNQAALASQLLGKVHWLGILCNTRPIHQQNMNGLSRLSASQLNFLTIQCLWGSWNQLHPFDIVSLLVLQVHQNTCD